MNFGARLFLTGFITLVLAAVLMWFFDEETPGETPKLFWHDYMCIGLAGVSVLVMFVGAYWFTWTACRAC